MESSDVFRFSDWKLYHSWNGRDEYFYNTVAVLDGIPGRFLSGHMLFVFEPGLRRGYVVIAGNFDWKIKYLECSK